MNNNDLKSTIIKLLNNIGSESEIRKYLNRFSDTESASFAIIKVGGSILKNDLVNLVHSLCFLKQIGLTPIIIHGAGPQLDQKLKEYNIKSRFKNGRRYTSSDTLYLARKIFIRENQKLVSALKKSNTDAVSLTAGVFDCSLAKEDLGLVGEIKSVATDLIENVLSQGAIPVITPLGETDDGQIVNINADTATFSLAKAIEPYKIVFLSSVGGILDQKGKIIPSISLHNDYQRLINCSWLHSGMNFKLQQINNILAQLPTTSSVSITTPSLLAKELFTHRGSGTLINKGQSIYQYKNWSESPKSLVKAIIESGFAQPLAANYFNSTPLEKLYITACNNGLIVISKPFEIPYLDKFTVNPSAKGMGIGASLWSCIVKDYPRLFWRAKPNNPINLFYKKVATGFHKTERWNIYWYGDIPINKIADCITQADTLATTIGSYKKLQIINNIMGKQ